MRNETKTEGRGEVEHYGAMKTEKVLTLASDIRNTLGSGEKIEGKAACPVLEIKSPVGVVKQNR